MATGAFALFQQILKSRALHIFDYTFSFQDASFHLQERALALKLSHVVSCDGSISIDHYEHTCSLQTLMHNFRGSHITIDTLHINKLPTEPSGKLQKMLPMGTASIEKVTINLPDQEKILLNNVFLSQNVTLRVKGKARFMGAQGSFSFQQGFRKHKLWLQWSLPQNSALWEALGQNLPLPKIQKDITGQAFMVIAPEKAPMIQTSLYLPDIHKTFSVIFSPGQSIQATTEKLSLQEVNYITNNTVHTFTNTPSWALQELSLHNVTLTIPFLKKTPQWNKLAVAAALSQGKVFVTNIGVFEHIVGQLRFSPPQGWAVDVSSATTSSGFHLQGTLDPKNAYFSLTAPTQTVISTFVNLDIIDAKMVTKAQGKVSGTLSFPTVSCPQWSSFVAGSFKTENSACLLNIQPLPFTIPAENCKLHVSFKNALCHIYGNFSWNQVPIGIHLDQLINPLSSGTDMHIRLELNQMPDKLITTILPTLTNLKGDNGSAHIQINKYYRAHKPSHFSVVAQGVAHTPYTFTIKALKKPLLIQQWSVDSFYKDGTWNIRHLTLQGSNHSALLSGSIQPHITQWKFIKASYENLSSFKGHMTEKGEKTNIFLAIPNTHLDDLAVVNKEHINTSPQHISIHFFFDNLFNKERKKLCKVHVFFDKTPKENCLSIFLNKKETSPLTAQLAWSKNIVRECHIKGASLSDFLSFLGLHTSTYSAGPFTINCFSRDVGLMVAIEAQTIAILMPNKTKKVLSSIFVSQDESLHFDQGLMKGCLKDALFLCEEASLTSETATVMVSEGHIDFAQGKIAIHGKLSPFKVMRQGNAILTPELAKILQKPSGHSPFVWPFSFEETFPPLSFFSSETEAKEPEVQTPSLECQSLPHTL